MGHTVYEPESPEYEALIQALCRVICEAGIHMGELPTLFKLVTSRLIPGDYLRNDEEET